MLFSELLVHEKTRCQLMHFLNKPSHALLIAAPAGSGKETLAKYLSAELLGTSYEKLSDYPYFTFLDKPDGKQEISIDSIRIVITKLRLKPVIEGGGQIKRLVLINQANLLSQEGQNALLKSIEEPQDNTVFIFTAPSDNSVLPTISSRVQKITVLPVSLGVATQYFGSKYTNNAVESSWRLSRGSIGLLSSILKDDKDHELKRAVEQAKDFLKMRRYERILFLDKISSDRAQLIVMLDALNRILSALHHNAINANNQKRTNSITQGRKLVHSITDSLNKNTSPRLAALQLALKLQV
jgi:DNA polymerase-3 subunit delta'